MINIYTVYIFIEVHCYRGSYCYLLLHIHILNPVSRFSQLKYVSDLQLLVMCDILNVTWRFRSEPESTVPEIFYSFVRLLMFSFIRFNRAYRISLDIELFATRHDTAGSRRQHHLAPDNSLCPAGLVLRRRPSRM